MEKSHSPFTLVIQGSKNSLFPIAEGRKCPPLLVGTAGGGTAGAPSPQGLAGGTSCP